MEPLSTVLLSTAATTVVKALSTDGWKQAKKTIVALWRRLHPERAEVISAEIDDVHSALVAARESRDEQVERDLVAEWQGRLRRLPVEAARLNEDLQGLVDLLRPLLGDGADPGHVEMHAHASDHATINQAGRDQYNITER
jgi:hypothetical protein